jgi:hypothetical protein
MPIYNPLTLNTESMRIEWEHDIWERAYTRDLRLDEMVSLTQERRETMHFDQMQRNTVTNERDKDGRPVWFAIVLATTDPVYFEGIFYFKYAGKRA